MDSVSAPEDGPAATPTNSPSPHPGGLSGKEIVLDVNVPPEEYRCRNQNYSDPTAVSNITDGLSAVAIGGEAESVKPEADGKKKKKKKKSKNKGISGFEDNYADAPITPEEYAEERSDLYHPSRGFAERIELAIQRYRARRKFDSHRKDIFDKYLSLGGIETGPKMFSGGVDHKNVDDKDADHIATMAATDAVNIDKQDSSKWKVDFEGIARAFFSSRAPECWEMETPSQIAFITSTIRNFLNYLLHHNVCPEYADDINATRELCDRANVELYQIAQINPSLPGDFNQACSTLYGGYYKQLWEGLVEKETWAKEVVMTGLATYGTDEQVALATKGLSVVGSGRQNFQVTEIIRASEETKEWYRREVKSSILPLGKIRAKPWTDSYAADEDFTDDEGDASKKPRASEAFEFWLEDELLQHWVVGMKLNAVVSSLNNGVAYFDTAAGVLASFYEELDAEVMVKWKKPREIPEDEEGAAQEENVEAADGEDIDD